MFVAGEEERVIQDLSKLSREEKLTVSHLGSPKIPSSYRDFTLFHCFSMQLLENDSPEMFELMEEFQDKFSIAMDTLHPLVAAARQDNTCELFTSEVNVCVCVCVCLWLVQTCVYLTAKYVPEDTDLFSL